MDEAPANVAARDAAHAPPLPDDLRAMFNGDLPAAQIIAWAEFDLDQNNAYRRQVAVLTADHLVVAVTPVQSISIPSIEECKVVEGLGVDRLAIIIDGKLAHELRYTRRCRREMQRLGRMLNRRLPKKDENGEQVPQWLDLIERRMEQQSHCPKCGRAIPDYADGVCPACLQKKAILWRLLDVAKPYRTRINVALAITLAVALLTALPPVWVKFIVDRGIGTAAAPGNFGELFKWGALFAVTVVITQLLVSARLLMLSMIGTSVARDLRHKVYAHMHDLSLRFFAKRRTGSLITRVTNDTDRLWEFIVFGSVDSLRNVVMIGVIAAIMFTTNWRLALVSLVPVPIVGLMTFLRGKTLHRMFGRLWTYWSRIGAVVGDALPGVRVVKAFANEQREIARFDVRSSAYTEKEQEVNRIWSRFVPAVGATMQLGVAVVWVFGGALVLRHMNDEKFSIGTLVMFVGFLHQFYPPIMELANSNRMVTRAASSAQRVFEVLDTPPEVFTRTGAVTKDRLEGAIEFRNVSFTYEGASPALREVSLTVEPGTMIGLCGPSGAGKSTFVNLICRFYDVTEGQILIDGVDLRDYDVKWLRRNIGLVLQEPYLFHGTIAENIRYGNPQATEHQIITAARAANAHDFVVGFPDGYDTMVGERGQSLSGGERQRISIARAILHNPRILILDEATSSVDTETEKQIQQALDRLVQGRTTIAIAHRLSTLQAANRLVVLEKGKLVEEGAHADLVDKDQGVYAKLYKTQMEMNQQVALR